MDFYKIKERIGRNGVIEVYPDFKVMRSKDLMVRGKQFYAIWDEEAGLWSTDEYDVQRLVDADLYRYAEELRKKHDGVISVKYLNDFGSNSWLNFRHYVNNLGDSSVQLDESLTFANTEVKKSDYVSRRLPYPLAEGDISAYEEIVSTLYDPEERAKLEWAVGSIIAGDSKYIQKFLVLYGPPGAGKGTYLNIIMKLFEGYITTFEAKALTGSSNSFSTDAFRNNPLVAIQHDGDLSKIEDNTKLNSIVSHEEMTINEKYKPSYTTKINSFLFMGTNKPVKITDAKSGIIRRLIDVQPSGRRIPEKRYHILKNQVLFELGAIAYHCLGVYRSMGMDYYSSYKPVEMMLQTDVFFNFIEDSFDIFKEQDGTTLTQAYALYKQYCDETSLEYKLPQYRFREELRNYFKNFEERAVVNGNRVRSWYSGFVTDHFKVKIQEPKPNSLVLDSLVSIFDAECAHQPAQYATKDEIPRQKWTEVKTTLKDIDTSKLHYVKPPLNHIVIDFDLKDEDGNKSLEKNIEEASKWPPTYAEISKGGAGIHLHYIYEGDVTTLSRIYSEGIEIKVFNGDSSLRRKLTECNNVPIATINSGLPLKEKKMISGDTIKSERSLRELISRNLRKEIHGATKPSVDFIHKILEDAYESDLIYDVSDMKGSILAFANNSTNQAAAAIKVVQDMKFKSKEDAEVMFVADPADDRLVFFDCEVFPNLFILNWKYEDDLDMVGLPKIVRMINPTPQAVEELTKLKLVGYNCRRYDNHILYGRIMGYDNEQLYNLSQKLINGSPQAFFGEAYNLSYTDVYDYASVKQGLKKWQIELGLHHQELGLPWDQPVPEEMWNLVAEYCDNDVLTTEAVHKARKQDYVARLILADLSGLTPNATTQQHTAKIIFGNDRRPQDRFVYTDLSEMFPGYKFDMGRSYYRGEITGEGGYVDSEPGMYENVAVFDIASMHPASIRALNLFGPYTENFNALTDARLAIKHKDYDKAKKMLNGVLVPYLKSEEDAKALSYALKIVINIVYGLTSANFQNPFKDDRNKDNIVAKRGALFMIDLKHLVQEHGYQVVHIKTDSIKVVGADQKIIDIIMDYGKKYGYDFEHEKTYEKFALVNDAVYIAKIGWSPDENEIGKWEAVGAQFQHPYVFKTLFSKEPIEFDDYRELKTVRSALYLDFDEDEDSDTPMALAELPKGKHFVGKAGSFIPVTENGGLLLREHNGEYYSATGAKGYRWMESEMVKTLKLEDKIDMSYYKNLVDKAVDKISEFGDFEWLTAD